MQGKMGDLNRRLLFLLGALIVYRIVPKQVRFMREWALDYHDVPLP